MKLIYKKETETIPEEKGWSGKVKYVLNWGHAWGGTFTNAAPNLEPINPDAWAVAAQNYRGLNEGLRIYGIMPQGVEGVAEGVAGIVDYPPNPQ